MRACLAFAANRICQTVSQSGDCIVVHIHCCGIVDGAGLLQVCRPAYRANSVATSCTPYYLLALAALAAPVQIIVRQQSTSVQQLRAADMYNVLNNLKSNN